MAPALPVRGVSLLSLALLSRAALPLRSPRLPNQPKRLCPSRSWEGRVLQRLVASSQERDHSFEVRRGSEGSPAQRRSRMLRPRALESKDSVIQEAHNGHFDEAFLSELEQLFLWRRDVRRFKRDPVDPKALETMLLHASIAPSVGNSQPWRYVMVEDKEKRRKVRENFQAANAEALADFKGEKAKKYASLKLAGLEDAPIHLAVFCDRETGIGHGLGRKTMPETLDYSVVGSIMQLWLSGRAMGVGVGWVSIIDPESVTEILEVPEDWKLIGYLCIGYPVEEHLDPELVRHEWQERLNYTNFIHTR